MKKLLLLFYILTGEIFPEEFPVLPDTLFKSEFQIANQLISKDTEGRLHIAFTAQTGTSAASREIFYAGQQADTFKIEQATNNYSEEIITSFFISKDSKLHLIFLGRDSDNLMQLYYMNNASGKFSRRIQLTKTPVSKAAAKAVMDRYGMIHIIYFTNTFSANQFYYKAFSTKNFSISNDMVLCDAEINNSYEADIALDAKDKLHIVVKAGSVSEGKLKYFNSTAGLLNEMSPDIADIISSPRIIINNNVINILYQNTKDKRLYWLTRKRNFSPPVPVTPENHIPVGLGNFTRDDANKIYITYQNIEASNFKTVYLLHFNDVKISPPIKLLDVYDTSILSDVSSTAFNDGIVSMLLATNLRSDINVNASLIYAKSYMFGNAVTSILSDTLSFGFCFIDDTQKNNIRIKNSGTTLLKIFSPSISDRVFSVELFDTLSILPDSAVDLQVSFNPTDTVSYSSALVLNTNAINGKTLKLNLTGYGSGYPKLVSHRDTLFIFDPIEYCDSVLIVNTGLKYLSVDSVKISSPLIKITYNSDTLSPGDSLYIKISLSVKKKLSEFSLADTINIYSNDPFSPIKHITVQRVNTTSSDDLSEEQQVSYELFQNYPNPFNPSTTISFYITQAAYIVIEVYDALAREIAELADGFFPSGVHNVTFNGDDLSTGIYYYKLHVKSGEKKTADHVEVRKMILVK